MSLEEYLSTIKNKTVSVIGIGVSNTPLLEKLLDYKISVVARDKHTYEEISEVCDSLTAKGCSLCLGDHYLDDLKEDIIFRTPGLRPDVPEIKKAVQSGSELTSEMELFFELCPCHTIAVTGSDGKTTTTSIIAGLLDRQGFSVHLGGNIGKPLLCEIDSYSKDDYAVLELSSFQLLTMQYSPEIAVVTNLAPNHLDMHKGMEEYIAAKKNIFLHQNENGICILNQDCQITHDFAKETKGTVLEFSRKSTVQNGAYLHGKELVLSKNGDEEFVLNIDDIKIPGMHNVENYMAAILAVKDVVAKDTIVSFAKDFNGVEHRIEYVRTYHGAKYYNDSIASSPSRTIAGLNSFHQKVILIAGGYDKHIPFDVLGPEILQHVKVLILCGATSEKIETAVRNAEGYEQSNLLILHANSLKEAAFYAREHAVEGDIVTLSPACAAFDQFKNFMVRGKTFKEIVNDWVE